MSRSECPGLWQVCRKAWPVCRRKVVSRAQATAICDAAIQQVTVGGGGVMTSSPLPPSQPRSVPTPEAGPAYCSEDRPGRGATKSVGADPYVGQRGAPD